MYTAGSPSVGRGWSSCSECLHSDSQATALYLQKKNYILGFLFTLLWATRAIPCQTVSMVISCQRPSTKQEAALTSLPKLLVWKARSWSHFVTQPRSKCRHHGQRPDTYPAPRSQSIAVSPSISRGIHSRH